MKKTDFIRNKLCLIDIKSEDEHAVFSLVKSTIDHILFENNYIGHTPEAQASEFIHSNEMLHIFEALDGFLHKNIDMKPYFAAVDKETTLSADYNMMKAIENLILDIEEHHLSRQLRKIIKDFSIWEDENCDVHAIIFETYLSMESEHFELYYANRLFENVVHAFIFPDPMGRERTRYYGYKELLEFMAVNVDQDVLAYAQKHFLNGKCFVDLLAEDHPSHFDLHVGGTTYRFENDLRQSSDAHKQLPLLA